MTSEKPDPAIGMDLDIRRFINESISVKSALSESRLGRRAIGGIAAAIINCYELGGKVILFGNGGSAADAQHIACELMGRFQVERPALQAIALNANNSILTAVGNDYHFREVFARQVAAWAAPTDVVMGISTSGNSPNVLRAVEIAKAKGATTVGLTGQGGGELAARVDICLAVPSSSTPRIQEVHITAGHIICALVEDALLK